MTGENRPNILFIMDDQHRFDWLGCLRPGTVETPNLDRLAAEGMHFIHCCTTSPVCAPARIALATGLMAPRTGAYTNNDVLAPGVKTHYQHFRDHGYRVELVGRTDLHKPGAPGSVHGNRPLNYAHGFTRALEIEGGMACGLAGRDGHVSGPYTKRLAEDGWFEAYVKDYLDRCKKGWVVGASHDSVLPRELHQDVFVGDAAVARLRRLEYDYSWYMFVSFQGPHDPFDPPADLGAKYRRRAMPEAIPPTEEPRPARIDKRREPFARATAEDIAIARRQYSAKVELIDRQVGKILDALHARDDAANTIVVFASDHGEMLGDFGLFQKQMAYEGALRVPLIVSGSGIARGRSKALVELFDLNPTLVDLAGLPVQDGLEAASFCRILRGEEQIHRDACVVCGEGYHAVRTRDYTYIENDDDLTELYDLNADPDQRRNVAEANPDRVAALAQALRRRLAGRARETAIVS